MKWIYFLILVLCATHASAEKISSPEELWKNPKIPVGTTRLKLNSIHLKPESLQVARYVTSSTQELVGRCQSGFKVQEAHCDLDTRAFGKSFDMSSDLNPTSTYLKITDSDLAVCHAALIRPDEVARLQLQINCVAAAEAKQNPVQTESTGL